MGVFRRLVLRLPVSLFIRLVTSLPSAGSRGRRLQPVHDHATGDGPEDQCACEQDRSDHAKTAGDALTTSLRTTNAGQGQNGRLNN